MFVRIVDYQRRVELIQDLWFETATTKIKATPDGEFLIASGVVKFTCDIRLIVSYMILCFNCLFFLSLKCELQVYTHLRSKYMN